MSKSRSALIAGVAALWALPAAAEAELDVSGFVEPEARLFLEEPSDSRQPDYNFSVAAQLEFELFLEHDQTIVVTPFVRLDQHDRERTHFDFREAYYEVVFDLFELRFGLKKVFWGRTEAAHLIDVINQTDTLESVDGEEKLGQPMVNVTVPTDYGIFDFYWLPYFRERHFEGVDGRPRFDVPVSNDIALYESDREEWHQDFAARWSHYVGAWDFGLSHFYGTSRDPIFIQSLDQNNDPILVPFYALMHQTAAEVQATYGPALFKFEGFHRWQLGEAWFQATGGIEYSIYQVFGTDADLGLVAEYIWDERGEDGFFPFQNDVFAGLRWTANDIQSTAILAGGIMDADGNGYGLSFEAERRFGADYFISLEGRFFFDVPAGDPLSSYSDDDFLQLRIARYF